MHRRHTQPSRERVLALYAKPQWDDRTMDLILVWLGIVILVAAVGFGRLAGSHAPLAAAIQSAR